jgi:hypothetical protein
MGACRESYKISHRLNYCKTFKSKIKELKFLTGFFTNKWNRKLIIKDNITTPYYKNIHCKLFGHKDFWFDNEDMMYFCPKCFKHFTINDYNKYKYKRKIKNII